MGRRGPNRRVNEAYVAEELKITVELALKKLTLHDEQKELELPSSLTSEERKYIHFVAQQQGFKSKSRGKGSSRYITVYKKEGSTIMSNEAVVGLGDHSRSAVLTLLQRYPVTNKERQDLLPATERDRLMNPELRDLSVLRSLGRLTPGPPQIPPPAGNSEIATEAKKLPIWSMKEQLLSAIYHNQVILVCGETGSGKTTQVPQMILQEASSLGKPCRIFCTEPRRISALTIAERVAAERGEKVGYTVGYQIRLESKLSPKTLLTFCTNGVLLRTLMGGESALATVTHILVDEVHERDRFTDFLLIVLRDCLPKFRHLKLVLMSASMDVNLYAKYFNNCPVVDVPGKCYPVKEYFLEDVLKYTKYQTAKMVQANNELEMKVRGEKVASAWTETISQNFMSAVDKQMSTNATKQVQEMVIAKKAVKSGKKETDDHINEEMDQSIQDAFLNGNNDSFSQMLYLIMSEDVSVDYQHSVTRATPLMVASGRGMVEVVEQLLSLGATVTLKSGQDWTAVQWAEATAQKEVLDLLLSYSACEGINVQSSTTSATESSTVAPLAFEISPEDKKLLDSYTLSIPDDFTDIDLIFTLCSKIHTSQPPGSILIFLPGYDDIVSLREKIITEDKKFSTGGKYSLFCLHSSMQSSDQKRVFKPAAMGVRKIILSTNIAETSITINDVVYVINSGKVKETSYDAMTGVSCLKAVWACRSSTLQRKGRAGRCQPGLCYHLISRSRYNSVQPHQTPEILRTPLQELCLYTKLLAPSNMPIADFLTRAPEPPAFIVIRTAVQLLKSMDALDGWEDVTELGHHLLDLPLPPRLAKMVITATILKCLDPVLTVAACLAYKDPFILPSQPSDKRNSNLVRRKFAAGSFSDHMVLLRAFQAWQKASGEGWERNWCERNFVSGATMEMIYGMRAQVLAQLRGAGFVRARGPGDIRDVNSNSDNWPVVKAALVSGMYPNLIRVDREQCQLRTRKESKVRLHPSSALLDLSGKSNERFGPAQKNLISSLGSDWLVYDEMVRIGVVTHVRNVTVVSPLTVLLLAGPMRLPLDALSEPSRGGVGGLVDGSSDSESEDRPAGRNCLVRIDPWVQFLGDPQAAHLALQLRHKLHALVLRRLRAPNKPLTQGDEDVVRVIAAVLSQEEQLLGLPQPSGVGQRPRPLFSHSHPHEGGSWGNNAEETTTKNNSQKNKEGSHSNSPPFALLSHKSNNNGNHSKSSNISKNNSTTTASTTHQDSKSTSTTNITTTVSGNLKPSTVSVIKSTTSTSTTSSVTTPSASVKTKGSNAGQSKTKNQEEPGSKKENKSNKQNNGKSNNNNKNRYFMIRVNSYKQIEASHNTGVWAFTSNTEKKILKAIQNSNVYLVFSIHRGNQFNGVVKFTGQKSDKKCQELTSSNSLGALYKVDWLKKGNINYHQTRHLYNPYNDNLQVHICSDGQEVESSVGEQLVSVWDKHPGGAATNNSNNHNYKNNQVMNNNPGLAMMHDPLSLPRHPLHHNPGLGAPMHPGAAQYHRAFRGYGNGGYPLNYRAAYRGNGGYRR